MWFDRKEFICRPHTLSGGGAGGLGGRGDRHPVFSLPCLCLLRHTGRRCVVGCALGGGLGRAIRSCVRPASHLRSTTRRLHHLRQGPYTGPTRLLGGRARPALSARPTRGAAGEVGLPCGPRRSRIGHRRRVRGILHTLSRLLLLGVQRPRNTLVDVLLATFGIGTLRARMVPRPGAWLLTIGGFPGIILMTILSGHLSGGLVLLDLAWIALGYALWTQRGLSAERHQRVR